MKSHPSVVASSQSRDYFLVPWSLRPRTGRSLRRNLQSLCVRLNYSSEYVPAEKSYPPVGMLPSAVASSLPASQSTGNASKNWVAYGSLRNKKYDNEVAGPRPLSPPYRQGQKRTNIPNADDWTSCPPTKYREIRDRCGFPAGFSRKLQRNDPPRRHPARRRQRQLVVALLPQRGPRGPAAAAGGGPLVHLLVLRAAATHHEPRARHDTVSRNLGAFSQVSCWFSQSSGEKSPLAAWAGGHCVLLYSSPKFRSSLTGSEC